jgi:hypothetical protein
VATRLVEALLADIGDQMDCIYTLISGENEPSVALAREFVGMKTTIDLTYAVLPVYRKLEEQEGHHSVSASELHRKYLVSSHGIDFTPEFNERHLLGYIGSVAVGETTAAGCSFWTNENLLAEQVASVPCRFRVMRILGAAARPFFRQPHIPRPGEIIRSWFLFDLFAENKNALMNLLTTANNMALCQNRHFLYALLQDTDPLLSWVMESGRKVFLLPYRFLAKGRAVASQTERIYIDVRDL